MRIVLIVLALGPVLVAGAAREDRKVVRALQYSVPVYASPLHAVHGEAQRATRLYLPGAGVLCSVERAPLVDAEGKLGVGWKVSAWYGPIGNRYRDHAKKTEVEAPTREVLVPGEIAAKIVELADLERRRERIARAATSELEKAGLLGEKPR
jgi:hypothetical protein